MNHKSRVMETTKARKRTGKSRNTAMFYALIGQLPGYDRRYAEVIKESVVDDYLTARHGELHGREARLTALSDAEYAEMLDGLRRRVEACKTAATLQREAMRKRLVHQILTALSRIGVTAPGGDYSAVNDHIRHLPISKGRVIPQFADDELPRLLGSVRAYCDYVRRKQQEERAVARRN